MEEVMPSALRPEVDVIMASGRPLPSSGGGSLPFGGEWKGWSFSLAHCSKGREGSRRSTSWKRCSRSSLVTLPTPAPQSVCVEGGREVSLAQYKWQQLTNTS